MTQRTITITTPRGGKVRTVWSRSLYLVLDRLDGCGSEGKTEVLKRTDSFDALRQVWNRWPTATAHCVVADPVTRRAGTELLTRQYVETASKHERRGKALARRTNSI